MLNCFGSVMAVSHHVCLISDSQPAALVPQRVCGLIMELQNTKTKLNYDFCEEEKEKWRPADLYKIIVTKKSLKPQCVGKVGINH